MSDLTKLKEILDNQMEKWVTSLDFDKCEYKCEKPDYDGLKRIIIDKLNIGFVFNRNGRFIGIFNWKE